MKKQKPNTFISPYFNSIMKDNLTSEQEAAINHFKGPAIVVAGPGAGKTFVITERVKKLIQDQKISPEKILVTTFTEKAATNLKVRLAKTIGKQAEAIHISTIHAFCKEMLEEFFQYHQYGSNINVLDEDGQNLVFELNDTYFGYAFWDEQTKRKKDIHNVWGNLATYVKALYNKITQNNVDVEEVIRYMKENSLLEEWQETILNGHKKYKNYLESERILDFASLQSNFYNLIKKEKDVLEKIQEKFEFILIDEYQDTSPIQDKIFKSISEKSKNIFVVGDENQSIYGFRGASIENFRKFSKNFEGAKEYFLSSNFRSTKNIVEASNKLFSEKIRKFLESKRREGDKIRIIDGEDINDSAMQAIELAKEMKEKKIISNYGDIAFLFRAKSHMTDYIQYLSEKKIPYMTLGGEYFLEREEIKVMLYLLSYITQNSKEGRFKNWLNWWRVDIFLSDFFNFSDETKNLLKNAKFNLSDLVNYSDFSREGFVDERDIEILLSLNNLKKEYPNKIKEGNDEAVLLRAFYELLDKTEYLERSLKIKNKPEVKESLKNLGKLSKLLFSYCSIRKKNDITGFLYYLHKYEPDFEQEKIENENCVKLMTVHKSKGLEFPVVFVNCLIEQRFPLRPRSNNFIEIPKKFLVEEKIEDSDLHYEEEKRLFYVAITRAQDHLIFTTSKKNKKNKAKRSRFLEEIPNSFLTDTGFEHSAEKKYELEKKIPSLNYSAINTFIDCPLRYTLIYDYGFVTPISFTQELGTFIHNTLQKIHEKMKNGEKLSLGDIADIARSHWINLPTSKERNESVKSKYIRRMQEYYREFAEKEYSEIMGIEESFSHIDDNMIIKGRVDLITKDKKGHNCIIDFKSRSAKALDKTNIEMQLQIYDYCLDKKYDIDELMAYTMNDCGKMIYGIDKFKIKEKLKSISEKMQKEDFHINKNEFCKECVFRNSCGVRE